MHKARSGFVGIASILIVTALIGIWLYYFSPLVGTKKTIDQEKSQGIEAIQAAENAKSLIENKNYGL